MKNNKILIIICVILLNALVVFLVGQNLMGKESDYDIAVKEARELAENELHSKSIEKYKEAIVLKDSVDLRLEMIDVYEKGLEIEEFLNDYEVYYAISDMVEAFKDEPKIYERASEFYLKHEQYETCAQILMQARDLHVTSDKIEEARKEVRYKYNKYFSMYSEVLPEFNGMYTVKSGENYIFLDSSASPALDGSYVYATSFSENYAFAKHIASDEKERNFLINKDGQRQVYLNEVETTSGVGMAKNKKDESIYLLACKVGDKYKYYDVNGKEQFDEEYEFAGRFRNNVAAVMESEGKWKLIDGTGKEITDTVFSDVILNEFDECAPKGLIIAKEGDKYHIYNLKGSKVGDFECDDAKAFVDELAAFKKDDKWGFVDAEGKVVIKPQYEDAKSFSQKMGAVKIGESWSLINKDNEVIIEETFEDVSYLNDKGICFVKNEGYWSYIKMFYTGE